MQAIVIFFTRLRTPLAFLFSGGMAFLTDASVFWGLMQLGFDVVLVARPVSIAVATVVGWHLHRTLTFQVAKPATLAEFAAYCVSASFSLAVNYGVFVLALQLGVGPLGALVLGSAVAMVSAFLGMKLVFGKTPRAK